jgi:hypothetical protein
VDVGAYPGGGGGGTSAKINMQYMWVSLYRFSKKLSSE